MYWIGISGHIILATVLISAAVGKSRAFSVLTDYLGVLFGSLAHIVGKATISVEGFLSAGLIIGMGNGLIDRVTLVALTVFLVCCSLFISVRLLLTNETGCHCWGATPLHQRDDDTDLGRRAIGPTWYGLRNGALLLSSAVLYPAPMHVNIEDHLLTVFPLFLVCPFVIMFGLVASIVQQWTFLKREEHPLAYEYASRLAPLVALSWYIDSGRFNLIENWQQLKP